MADGDRLTLRQAREQGRIDEFAAQAERERAEAVPITAKTFDAVLGRIVKASPARRRTSGSQGRDGLSGRRTRQDT